MKQEPETRYVHLDSVHNLRSPRVIVPDLIRDLAPRSVVDVGSGIGTFLSVFIENGIEDVLGVDGSWVDRGKLYTDEKYFVEADLEQPLELGRRFDLAVCLEVAEHLKPEAADTIIASLCSLSDSVVFSAAIPGQGGDNHINEQPFEYWQEKFAARGYQYYDIFRDRYWQNDEVDCWYRQNMFLVVHESVELPPAIAAKKLNGPALVHVHPLFFEYYSSEAARQAEVLRDLKTARGLKKLAGKALKKIVRSPK